MNLIDLYWNKVAFEIIAREMAKDAQKCIVAIDGHVMPLTLKVCMVKPLFINVFFKKPLFFYLDTFESKSNPIFL